MTTRNEAAPPPHPVKLMLMRALRSAGGVKGVLAQVAVAAGTAHLQKLAADVSESTRDAIAARDFAVDEYQSACRELDQVRRLTHETIHDALSYGIADQAVLDRAYAIEQELRGPDETPVYAERLRAGWQARRNGPGAVRAAWHREDPVDADVIDDEPVGLVAVPDAE